MKNLRIAVDVTRQPHNPEGNAWPKSVTVSVVLELEEASRGDAVVGTVSGALDQARRLAVDTIKADR